MAYFKLYGVLVLTKNDNRRSTFTDESSVPSSPCSGFFVRFLNLETDLVTIPRRSISNAKTLIHWWNVNPITRIECFTAIVVARCHPCPSSSPPNFRGLGHCRRRCQSRVMVDIGLGKIGFIPAVPWMSSSQLILDAGVQWGKAIIAGNS